MHIVLTGGTGFIGSHLTKKLISEGHQLTLITRPNSSTHTLPYTVQPIPYDGSYESLLPAFTTSSIDAVIHLAAFSQFDTNAADISPMIAANLTFGSHLLEAMAHHNCPYFINTGTFSEHKTTADYSPCCFYASTKHAFSAIVDYYCQERNITALTLKLTDSYGTNDPRQKLFQFLADSHQKGQVLDMTPGQQMIHLTHVDDICHAYLIGLNHLTTQPQHSHQHYFVAGNPHRLQDVVKTYQQITGQCLTINWGGIDYRPSQVMQPFIGACLPQWQPTITLEEGIASLHLSKN